MSRSVCRQKINWKVHVSKTCDKVSPKIDLLRRLSRVLSKHLLSKVYTSIVKPHIEYCLSVWGNCAKVDLNKLQRLQNRAARIVTNNYDYDVHSIDLVRGLKWLSVTQLRDLQLASLMYKCINDKVPHYLSDSVNFNNDGNFYETRSSQSNMFHIDVPRKVRCEQAFSYKGPMLYNSLPAHIRDSSSYFNFKKEYKKMCFNSDN